MGNPYLTNAGAFLVNTLFGLYILAIMLRLIAQWVRADFYNPVVQFLYTVTEPAIRPLRSVMPLRGPIDWAGVTVILGLQLIKLFLIGLIAGKFLSLGGLLLISLGDLLNLFLNIYLFTILIQVILSWVSPGTYHPAIHLLYQINEPVLGPARRIIPPISGLDLSPLVVIIAIQLVKMLVVAPINDMGWGMALG
ncbi:MAG: YggT family protein [Gammaproteobacteria bacterium]|nr:MAG: YggT family protein [Gammaproteobacteria bacterium]